MEPLSNQPQPSLLAERLVGVGTVAKITNINAKLPVELVEKLLLFVGTRRHKHFKKDYSAPLWDDGAFVVSRQFDLRYVCLLWHNVVHRLARLGLRYWSGHGDFLLFDRCRDAELSRRRQDTGLLECHVNKFASTKKKRSGEWLSLFDCIQSIHVCVFNDDNRGKSISFALRNATQGLEHPCDLSLNLSEHFEALGCLARDPCADFEAEYPTLTLRSLRLDFSRFLTALNEELFTKVIECTNYCFSMGKQTLSRAEVQLSALDGLPEDWVCDTLQDLSLDLSPLDDRWKRRWSANRKRREFAKQARIPRLFPRLEKIELSYSDWPHVDLACLDQLAHLKTLELYAPQTVTRTAKLRRDWRLACLPRVETLLVCYHDGKFPMPLSEFVPSLTNLTVHADYPGACSDLQSDVGANRNGCTQLKHLSVQFGIVGGFEDMPTPTDTVALFAGLRQLPVLSSLEFCLRRGQTEQWCHPGDLTLLHVLPPQLSSASMSYCFLPAATIAPWGVNFKFDPNVINAAEWIYKSWFLLVIHRLCDFPKLERFYCKIVAPSFHAVVSLASRWSNSSAVAIADLGLASVIRVSCSTDAYLSIEPGQTYCNSDTLTFRFTLAPRPHFVSKKFPTRLFTFELER